MREGSGTNTGRTRMCCEQKSVKETIDLLCECKDKIRRLGLFSINETAEEYGASDLK